MKYRCRNWEKCIRPGWCRHASPHKNLNGCDKDICRLYYGGFNCRPVRPRKKVKP